MKASYRLQRQDSLVDYVLDTRPEHIRDQQLPVIELNATLNTLELIFDSLKAKAE